MSSYQHWETILLWRLKKFFNFVKTKSLILFKLFNNGNKFLFRKQENNSSL